MKKRYHTNRSRFQFLLNGSSSNRSLRNSLKGVGVTANNKLANISKSSDSYLLSSCEDSFDDEEELKLADEISENELNAFSFSCIESVAGLSGSKDKNIDKMLIAVIRQKLGTFVNLAQERLEAEAEFRGYVVWSKQFISGVQPLLNSELAPVQEVNQLNEQAVQCAERSLCQKYRSETLSRRVGFLEGEVADYLVQLGVEMGFPESVMQSVGRRVRRALGVISGA